MSNKIRISIFWFRRDLRLNDNHGLYQALSSGRPVLPIFIFDKEILDKLDKPIDLRVQFIHETIEKMNKELSHKGSRLEVFYGRPKEVFERILSSYDVESVHANHDYEPYALERDGMIDRKSVV